jgi:hypothetical protein
MNMTRLYSTGIETGETSEFEVVSGLVQPYAVSGGRTGSYSVRFNTTEAGRIHFTSSNEIYMGFGYYGVGGQTASRFFLKLRTAAGGVVAALMTADNTLTALTAHILSGSSVGTITIPTPSIGAWHYFEIYCKVDATAGEFTLKGNGEQLLTWTGNTGSTNIANVQFGHDATNGSQWYLDDLVINNGLGLTNNTWTGQPKLFPVRVNGAGSVTQLTPSAGTANWDLVDEVPASNTDYVYSGTADQYDLYTVTSTASIPTGATINNLIVTYRSRVESGTGAATSKLKTGDTTYEGEDNTLNTTFKNCNDCYPTDEDGVIWTLDRVNAVEIGPMTKEIT